MNSLELVHFRPDDILFNEGEETFFFYMIKEGEVEVFRQEGENKIVLAIAEAGQSLGEFAMIDRKPRSASARALGTVIAVKISEEAYSSLLEELPTWAQAMMEGLVSRLRSANEIIQQNESIDSETRVEFENTKFTEGSKSIKVDLDFGSLSPKKTG